MAARCPDCGHEVRWAKREDGSWHPPLELVQVGLVIGRGDGVIREELVWQEHTRLDVEVERFLARQGRRSQQNAGYQAAREQAYRLAVSVPCPTCPAQADAQCLNLTRRRAGVEVPTRSPHPPRLRAGVAMARQIGSREMLRSRLSQADTGAST